MGVGVEHQGSPIKHRPRIAILPSTRLGWWTVGLTTAFFPLVFAAGLIPRAAALGLVCGLAGGIAAAIAIVRDHERAVSVFVAFVPFTVASTSPSWSNHPAGVRRACPTKTPARAAERRRPVGASPASGVLARGRAA
jgi:uncharacterized membrane protein YphA (DoxX/SURF4 family)